MSGFRALMMGLVFAAEVANAALPVSGKAAAPGGALASTSLTPAQSQRLAVQRSQHLKARARLPKDQQAQLDGLAVAIQGRLFAALPDGDLFASATQLVRETVPDLDDAEAEGVAEYALGAIASGAQRNAETQMSFNLQYLQLLSRMQALNRDYEALGAVLKAKHDAVENSIGNVR
jgi:hypothetical protein